MTLTYEDYTVGWVCALPQELAAARGMLEEEHHDLPAEASDCNAYVLGRIGSHNVVLACLPVGETGAVPSAMTVMRMKSTFRCLEIGLLVGVGGGAPSENHDIRLGDVVVGDSGVIQYDMGKTVQGGRFMCTQDRLRPPQGLLLALSKLQAGNLLREHRMDGYINEMTSRHPVFSHPGVDWDNVIPNRVDRPIDPVTSSKIHRVFNA
ncbi:nucleoside phosphorylase domain-containing protein [Aspergillus insuetus]